MTKLRYLIQVQWHWLEKWLYFRNTWSWPNSWWIKRCLKTESIPDEEEFHNAGKDATAASSAISLPNLEEKGEETTYGNEIPAVIAKTDYNSNSQTKTMAVVVEQPMAMEFLPLLPEQITIPIHRIPVIIAKTNYNSNSQTKTRAVVGEHPMAMIFLLLLPKQITIPIDRLLLLLPKQITIPIHRPRPWPLLWNNLWQWNSCVL